MNKTLEIVEFSKSYEKNSVLENVNKVFHPGKIYALIAPNGSGKTTLMKCIVGLSNNYKGVIAYDKKIANFEKISYSPSIPLFEKLSVSLRSYIRRFCILRGLYFSDVLKKFHKNPIISKLIERKCSSISTGEKKLFQIFLDFLPDPEIVVLDEPLNGLDYQNRNLLIEGLLNFSKKGKTVIFSTHILQDLDKIADEVLIIKDKKILSFSRRDAISVYEEYFPSKKSLNENDENEINLKDFF